MWQQRNLDKGVYSDIWWIFSLLGLGIECKITEKLNTCLFLVQTHSSSFSIQLWVLRDWPYEPRPLWLPGSSSNREPLQKLGGREEGKLWVFVLFPSSHTSTKAQSSGPAALSRQSSVPPGLGTTPSSCPCRAREPRCYSPSTVPSLWYPHTLPLPLEIFL